MFPFSICACAPEVTIRDTVKPIREDMAKCANLPARTAGFVVVANNEQFFAEAGLAEMPCLANWTIIHFNDCKVGWPRGPGSTHVLIFNKEAAEKLTFYTELDGGFYNTFPNIDAKNVPVLAQIAKWNATEPRFD